MNHLTLDRIHRPRPRTLSGPFGVLAVLGFLAASLSTGCRSTTATAPATQADAAASPVATAAVGRATVHRHILLPAEVRAWQEVTLHAKTAGYVRAIAVDRGDRVKAGSIVAELEAPELVADVAKARADAALAATLAGRVGNARSKAPDLVVAQSVDEAAAKLEVARAALSRAETLLSFATIRAPFDAVVTERFVDLGAFVPAATATATPRTAAVVTIADFTRLRVAAAIPEAEAMFVRVGTPATVRTDEAVATSIEAEVSRIAWSLDRNTRTMMAEIDLDNAALQLRPGMLVHVRFAVEAHTGVLSVPTAAVLREKAGSFVFLIGDGSRVRKTPVRTGFSDDARVEILDGPAEGATLALVDKQPLRDGQAVQPVKSQ